MDIFQFRKEVEASIAEFERQWVERNKQDGEAYPLELESSNSGLWSEFFLDFMNSGEI